MMGRLAQTRELGTDFWNDSATLNELTHAVETGATGATSNPVIVGAAVQGDWKTWQPVLRGLIRDFPKADEDELSWLLVEGLTKTASKFLLPIFEKTQGREGFLSAQTNAKLYRNREKMLEHGLRLASLAPNIAIKAPATVEGIWALEEMAAKGVRINATVSFSVSQAVAVAEAMERAYLRAPKDKPFLPYVTLMVGRIDDHLKRVQEKENLATDPKALDWAGIAVAKNAYKIFKSRGFRSRLLIAAYRHEGHWSELIGPDVIQTMPYAWWNKCNASEKLPTLSIENPVEQRILGELLRFKDFHLAYQETGLKPEDFVRFGPTVHTLNQFLGGYQKLVELVRREMLQF